MVILQIWGSVLRIKEATTTRRSNHCLQATINQAIHTYQRTTTKECAERTAKCIYKWRLRGPQNLLHQCFSLNCYNCWRCWFDVDLGRALCGGCVNKEIWRTKFSADKQVCWWVILSRNYIRVYSFVPWRNKSQSKLFCWLSCSSHTSYFFKSPPPLLLPLFLFKKEEEEKKGVASSATQCATNSYMESVLLRIWSNLKQSEMQIRFQPEIGKPTWRNTGFLKYPQFF